MPDPGEDYQRWSTVADNNGNIDSLIDWHEGQARRTVNNSSRSEMASHAKNRNLLNGSIVTTGTKNQQAFLSGVSYLTIPTGLRATLKIGSGLTNDGPLILNMDGTGPVAVKLPTLTDCNGGEFVSDRYVDLIYNGTFWIYLYSAGNFAPLRSPVFTGDPQAPTPPLQDSDNSIATTGWVQELVFGGEGIVLSMRMFSSAGTATYTPHAAMKSCIVECIGGGGGGGGANSGGGANGWFVGGGGGAGGYSRKLVTATTVGASQTITVGAGGGAGGGGPSDGLAGGTTSFGALCIAKGGGGGAGAGISAYGLAGVGGTTTGAVGDLVAAGAPGQAGFYHEFNPPVAVGITSSSGGSSAFGGGGTSHSQGAGVAGGNYGSGGSGGGAVGGAGSSNAGAGSAGVVIITEFSGAGVPGPQGAIGPIGPTGPSGPGTGDVIHSGTPVAGQIAQWTDASHIQGVAAATLSGFTTGDVKMTHKTVADSGWIMWVDGSIGSATSGSSLRANADTQALFTLYFNTISDASCPIFTNAGSATTRAAQGTAATAWTANCRISVPLGPGRALALAGTGAGLSARTLAATAGAETIQLLAAHLPTNTGLFSQFVNTDVNYAASGVPGNLGFCTSQGADTFHPNMQPTTFLNAMIKL